MLENQDKTSKILHKELLISSPHAAIVKLEVYSPQIARKAQAGQFVVVMAAKEGERTPLTVVSADKHRGTVTLIIQAAGFTTKVLSAMSVGDSLYSLAGPLGHPTEIKRYGQVVLVGGGVGIAEIYPVAKALKSAGNKTIVIIGSRSKELLILEKELVDVADNLIVTTDDGSYGRGGFVTEALKECLEQSVCDLVYAVGPIPMMRAVAGITAPSGVRTIVSLNALMVDGTGMCGCCRVTVGGQVKFSCVDGPEFDALLVNWQELLTRNSVYSDKEQHICRLPKDR